MLFLSFLSYKSSYIPRVFLSKFIYSLKRKNYEKLSDEIYNKCNINLSSNLKPLIRKTLKKKPKKVVQFLKQQKKKKKKLKFNSFYSEIKAD